VRRARRFETALMTAVLAAGVVLVGAAPAGAASNVSSAAPSPNAATARIVPSSIVVGGRDVVVAALASYQGQVGDTFAAQDIYPGQTASRGPGRYPLGDRPVKFDAADSRPNVQDVRADVR